MSQQIQYKLNRYKRKYYLNLILRGSLITLLVLISVFLFFNFVEYNLQTGKTFRGFIFFSYLVLSCIVLYRWLLVHLIRLWLKNQQNLKASQAERLQQLTIKKLNLKTNRAYHIRLNFQELYKQPVVAAEAFLKKWYFWATHSRLEPIKEAAYTIRRHWDGILRWFTSRINNGILEGINSLIQAAKARARGYRTKRNLITMIYLLAGKLDFGLPT